ncbi:MAG TPA: nitrate/nitrite transporter NrtS [Acidimicrobiales bacterium]|nr:nitrate/nitrite transporter NrtS [Acidimicrobiales bacterium]
MLRAEQPEQGTGTAARDCSQGHPNPFGHPYCGKCGEHLIGQPPPMWTGPAEAMAVIRHPPHLRRTLLTALIVGTLLFCINQLDVVLAGDATSTVWFKGALTYLVPFAVTNVGILIATHRRR